MLATSQFPTTSRPHIQYRTNASLRATSNYRTKTASLRLSSNFKIAPLRVTSDYRNKYRVSSYGLTIASLRTHSNYRHHQSQVFDYGLSTALLGVNSRATTTRSRTHEACRRIGTRRAARLLPLTRSSTDRSTRVHPISAPTLVYSTLPHTSAPPSTVRA